MGFKSARKSSNEWRLCTANVEGEQKKCEMNHGNHFSYCEERQKGISSMALSLSSIFLCNIRDWQPSKFLCDMQLPSTIPLYIQSLL